MIQFLHGLIVGLMLSPLSIHCFFPKERTGFGPILHIIHNPLTNSVVLPLFLNSSNFSQNLALQPVILAGVRYQDLLPAIWEQTVGLSILIEMELL